MNPQHSPRNAPEPVEWGPRPSLRQRLSRATAVPIIAGVAVFVVAVIIAIVMTVARGSGGSFDAEAVGIGAVSAEGAGPVGDTGGSGGSGGAGSAGNPASADGSGAGSGSSGGGRVFVHVVGEVQRPGVVELDAGTRVADAIEAAGGATPEAVLTAVNLARVLADGEQIVVPDEAGADEAASQGAGSGGGNGGAAGAGGAGAAGGPIDLNAADTAALETLPRIGPALAQRIVDWREANGGFASVEQLMEVSGIGPKVFEALREQVTV